MRWAIIFRHAPSIAAALGACAAALSLASPLPISGQPLPRFTHLGLDDGLSQSSVSAIVQDRFGLLWFGTQDGLNRWDGHDFTVYRSDPNDPSSLGATTITALAADPTGVLWIASFDRGLWQYDPGLDQFRRVPISSEGDPSAVLAVATWQNLVTAVGTAADGLILLDAAEHPLSTTPPVDRPVRAVAFDPDGRLWIGAADVLLAWDGDGSALRTVATVAPPGDPLTSAITNLSVDRDGSIWVGATNGLWRYDQNRKSLDSVTALRGTPIRSLAIDGGGRLWVGTRANGLVLFDPATTGTVHLRHDPRDPTTLATNLISSVYEDSFGVLWVGVEGHGISRYDPSRPPFRHIRSGEEGLGGRIVRAVATSANGELWVGTADGGLDRFAPDGALLERYRNRPGDPSTLSSDAVWTIQVDRQQRVWVGTRGGGLNRLDPSTGRLERYEARPQIGTSLSSNAVLSLLETTRGSLFVGTANGLDQYTPESDSFRPVPLGDDQLLVRTMAEGQSGTVWIGSEGGLFRLDPGSSRAVPIRPPPSTTADLEPVLALHWSSDHLLWIGTQQGIVRYDPDADSWYRFDRRHGLPNDVVYAVLEDAAGDLWLSSNKGLCRVRPPRDPAVQRLEVRSFDRTDGLQGNEFNGGAVHACSGTFFFGGINGLTVFRPEQIPPPPQPPPVTLLQATLLSSDRPERVPLFGRRSLILEPSMTTVSIQFTALALGAPETYRYSYRLDGFDPNWIATADHRFATYTNLDPGEYTFQVRAGQDGRWSPTPAKLVLLVQPPWWRTYWAYAGYGLLLALAVLLTDRIQRRRLLTREREQSQLREAELRARAAEAQARVIENENERKSRELEEARSLQLSMLPHELPTIPGLEIAARMVTATEVGGDYYDLCANGSGLAVAIGDATGHGLAAGTVVSVVKGVFSAAGLSDRPQRLLARCNGVLRRMQLRRLHMAMSVLHLHGDSITFATAGMPPLLIHRASSGAIEEAYTAGLPLGSLEDASYDERTVVLADGDTILAVSDGLPETLDPSGEPFGYTRLTSAFQSLVGLPPMELADRLLATGEAWRGTSTQQDDLTVLVLRRSA